MSETTHAAPMPDLAMPDLASLLAGLCGAGAASLDPVGLHFIEALARRAATQQGRARALLDAKIARAVADLTQRAALQNATAQTSDSTPPHTTPRLSPLGELTRQLGAHATEDATLQAADAPTGLRPELKAVSQFRSTWARLSADKQLNKALGEAPTQAGPINSHMLVLRSLALMRELSPDYVNRFMSYAEALVGLDAIDTHKVLRAKPVDRKATARSAPATPKKRRT